MSSAILSAVAYWESKAGKAINSAMCAPHLSHHESIRADPHNTAGPRHGRKPGPKPAVIDPVIKEKIRAERAAGATLPTLALRYRTHYRTLYRILADQS